MSYLNLLGILNFSQPIISLYFATIYVENVGYFHLGNIDNPQYPQYQLEIKLFRFFLQIGNKCSKTQYQSVSMFWLLFIAINIINYINSINIPFYCYARSRKWMLFDIKRCQSRDSTKKIRPTVKFILRNSGAHGGHHGTKFD